MITIYTDINVENLDENYDFIIIECDDGIWDCLMIQQDCMLLLIIKKIIKLVKALKIWCIVFLLKIKWMN